jgi:hypothetical protein
MCGTLDVQALLLGVEENIAAAAKTAFLHALAVIAPKYLHRFFSLVRGR